MCQRIGEAKVSFEYLEFAHHIAQVFNAHLLFMDIKVN